MASHLKGAEAEAEEVAVEGRSTNTNKKKKKDSSDKKHQILADVDQYTGAKENRYTSYYFPSNSHHPSTQNHSKTHKLSTPATKPTPSVPEHNSDRSSSTKIQNPTTFILFIRRKTPPLPVLNQNPSVHSFWAFVSGDKKKKHVQEASTQASVAASG